MADKYACTVAEPYNDLVGYLLDAGQPLNDKGILAVYEAVLEYLDAGLWKHMEWRQIENEYQ